MPRRVLFLCTGNYYRSRFAEALFNELAGETGIGWEADSCGLNVAVLLRDGNDPGPISAFAVAGLKERGIVVGDAVRRFRQVGEGDFLKADLVVAVKEAEHRPLVEKLHPEWAGRVRYWAVHDLDFAPPEVALVELEGLVRGLVEELAGNSEFRVQNSE